MIPFPIVNQASNYHRIVLSNLLRYLLKAQNLNGSVLFFIDEAQGDKQKETIRAKCVQYLDRAEKLKAHIKDPNKKKKPVRAESDAGGKNNSDSDSEDPERKKLQDRLQGEIEFVCTLLFRVTGILAVATFIL